MHMFTSFACLFLLCLHTSPCCHSAELLLKTHYAPSSINIEILQYSESATFSEP